MENIKCQKCIVSFFLKLLAVDIENNGAIV